MKKNQHAQALGRLSKGKKKTLTPEERENRKERMRYANSLRWKERSSQIDSSKKEDGLENA